MGTTLLIRPEEASARQNGPLEGIRILELGSLVAGQIAGRLLADMGVEVIKIETLEAGEEIIKMIHEARGICEVIAAISFDCPLEGPTPANRVADIVKTPAGADRICGGT